MRTLVVITRDGERHSYTPIDRMSVRASIAPSGGLVVYDCHATKFGTISTARGAYGAGEWTRYNYEQVS